MKGNDKAVSDRRGRTGKHDLLPTFPGCRAKEDEECLNQNQLLAQDFSDHLGECLEIVVLVYNKALSWFNLPKDLNRKKDQEFNQ